MLHYYFLFFAILFLGGNSWGQDERYYRQMLTGELPKFADEIKEVAISPISLNGPYYHLDLTGDGRTEIIQPTKKDGVDWLMVYDANKSKIFEAKLLAMGGESVIYKLKLVHLSPTVKTLIIFLDEGATHGEHFESTARIFLLSYEKNDLSTLSLAQGPHYFHEKLSAREQYIRRQYLVDVVDFNGDGTREIAVHYHHIQRIMEYTGSGEWKRY